MPVNKNNVIIKLITAAVLLLSANLASAGPLTDFDGNTASINDYAGKGKWLVVMFWASDCHICNKEAHQYVALHKRNKDDGNTQVLGVSTDGLSNKAVAQGFIDEHKLNFPNLIGTLDNVGAMYYDMIGEHWVGTPTILIYSPEGKIRAAQAGAVPSEIIEDFIQENS